MNKRLFVATVLLTAAFISIMIYEKNHPYECTRSSVVTEILELRYREAIVQLADGERVQLNQATLKVGDSYCTNWKRS